MLVEKYGLAIQKSLFGETNQDSTFSQTRKNSKMFKVACRVKTNTTWTTKNTISFHYFSKKIKTNTLQGHKKYIKLFELEINNLRIQILAAKMT